MTDTGGGPIPLPAVSDGSGRSAEEWISLIRVLMLLTLIPALWFEVITVAHPAINGIILLLGGYVILLAAGPRWFAVLRRPDLAIALDLLVITLVVVISGNLSSPFIFLYYLTILEAAARLNLRQALAASLAMAGMIVLLWVRAGRVQTLESAGFRLGAIIAGGFFLALFLGMMVQEYRVNRERLRWTRVLDQRLREATSQLEDQLHELQFYNALAARLSGELRVGGVLDILLQVFLEAVQFPCGLAYICGDGEEPRVVTTRGIEEDAPRPELPPFLIPSAEGGGGDLIVSPSTGDGKQGEILAYVPLVRGERLQAWLCGIGPSPGAFTESVRRRVRGLAAQGVSALEAARLHERVNQNLEQSHIQVVLALARTVEARDTYTAGHSERIASLAEAVGRALGCGEEEVRDIRRAALLHDIGKIGVPDQILRKPGPLTKEERAVMQHHAIIGEGILLSVERMRGVAKLVRYHQECWDGSGYPDGLSGEEIPLGARILAVVDAYSAMVDRRSYKRARPGRQAIKELEHCAGTQFDPRIVRVFCRMIERLDVGPMAHRRAPKAEALVKAADPAD
jgi:putative nucleotidyltransferase with HDIG domain